MLDATKRQVLIDSAKFHASLRLASMGGGGQPPPPPPPDYEAQARAQIAQQNNQARLDAEGAARAKAEKDAADALAEGKFQSQLTGAYNSAQNYGKSRINSLGIDDTYGILDAYNANLDRTRLTVPDKDPNPGNYFTPTLFDDALNQQRTTQRNKFNQQFNQIAPTDFEKTYIPDTMDDNILSSIVGDQYNDASQYLQRAQSRGQLTPDAFGYANKQLGNARSGATARANDLGMGVLTGERDVLGNLAKQGRDQITNFDFGDNFDPNSYSTKFQNEVNSFTPMLEGRIRNTIGDTQFFDPQSLLTKAGTFMGAQNLGGTQSPTGATPGLLSAIAGTLSTDSTNKKTQSGSQGVF